MFGHKRIEKNALLLLVAVILVVSAGALVEIIPLFYIEETVVKVGNIRPLSPLELSGQQIYKREGCYLCHTQMIRALREDVARYGQYSLAAESMYDRPSLWGSKRTGPDIARVGGRYSDAWHVQHMRDPRSLVPASIMPAYPHLEKTHLQYGNIKERLITLRRLGNPYTASMIKNAKQDLETQVSSDVGKLDDFLQRYHMAHLGNLDNQKEFISELDALIAYLQVLGVFVDSRPFYVFNDKANNE